MKKRVKLGLIGKDVSASTSHLIHRFILDKLGYECDYEKCSVGYGKFDLTVQRLLGDFDGFNVTIPYKRDIVEYLDEVAGDAFTFGAVNTVVCQNRTGYNTDGAGFTTMLRLAGVEVAGKKILVLGGGGAGRSTAVALRQAGGEVYLYQRNREKLEETSREIGVLVADDPERGGYDILVNATGVGMHDKVGLSPVTEAAFRGGEWAIDLIYHPKQTEFMRLAANAGLRTLNGEGMLFYQAYYADCLFLGREKNEEEAKALYEEYQKNRIVHNMDD